MKRSIGAVLVWGAAWGVFEATAGHLVHLVKIPNLPGLVMLPAAAFFMSRAFARSGRAESIFLAGCFASAIKFATILLPWISSRGAVNPALAILAESLFATGVITILKIPYLNTQSLDFPPPGSSSHHPRRPEGRNFRHA